MQLQNKQYVYGTDWLPHDGVDTIIHHKLAGGGDRSMSIEMLMRQAGRKPRIVPKMLITDQLNAARTIFPQCRFDERKCANGIQALRHYRWPPLSADGVAQRKPLQMAPATRAAPSAGPRWPCGSRRFSRPRRSTRRCYRSHQGSPAFTRHSDRRNMPWTPKEFVSRQTTASRPRRDLRRPRWLTPSCARLVTMRKRSGSQIGRRKG